MSKSFYIESLGCPKNLVDSEVFAYIAERNGYEITDEIAGADLVLVNTCSFLQASVDELYAVMAEIAELKTQQKIGTLVVTGCIMNRYAEEIKNDFPEITAFVGLKDFAAFEKLISARKLARYRRSALMSDTYTYLRISDGCSNHCSYCKIPSIRGELVSRPMDEIIEEAKYQAKQGFSELILIAQDLSAYGKDIYHRLALADLLAELHNIKQFKWIRLMYLHPAHVTEELVKTIAALPKVVHSFEMPLQHINDDILQAMHRPYRKQDVIRVLEMFRKYMPDCVFRTTFITGFPGESRKQFNELMQFIRDYPFLRMGAFAYSEEEGTPASELDKPITAKTRIKRQTELTDLQRELAEELLSSYIDQDLDVIVEDYDPDADEYYGRAWFDAPDIDGTVTCTGSGIDMGDMVSVKIDDIIDIDLFGRVQTGKS